MLPADLDGSTLPPAGAPNSYVLFPDTSTYRVYHFHVDFAVPANSTFTLFGTSPTAGFTELFTLVPQLGGEGLDNLADRLMFRLAYRNFGDHESLVGNFTVRANNIAAPRWFELRGVTAGPITTFQDSTYQPDTTWRWMGSVAMDKFGNMALGYSASDATIHPQIRYTGRLGTDPINMMTQGEGHIWDGAGSQVATSSRWGDYSDMTVDPVDDQTFWFTTEYYDTTSSFNWRTRIANFKLATGGGGDIVLQARLRTQGTKHQVQLKWSPADGGNMNILRNGAVIATTPDDGKANSNLGTRTGEFTYQVCETDSGDCSNEVTVNVP
jgi:hypothetical protein